jgi:ribosomal protein S18 acetylase RimI-like enzyme
VIEIRPFRPADQPAVRALVLAGLAERWGTLDETRNPDLDDIHASYIRPGGTVLVAEQAGRVVGTGTLAVRNGTGQIVRMSVVPELRRQGLARRLVAALVADARQRSLARVVVETTRTWQSAVALYEACGFVAYACDDDDVHLQLSLT